MLTHRTYSTGEIVLEDRLELAGENLACREDRGCSIVESVTAVDGEHSTAETVQHPAPAAVLAAMHLKPMLHS